MLRMNTTILFQGQLLKFLKHVSRQAVTNDKKPISIKLWNSNGTDLIA